METKLLQFITILNDFASRNDDDFYDYAETKGYSEADTDERFTMIAEFLTDKGMFSPLNPTNK